MQACLTIKQNQEKRGLFENPITFTRNELLKLRMQSLSCSYIVIESLQNSEEIFLFRGLGCDFLLLKRISLSASPLINTGNYRKRL
jgi:hypothetical protein